MMEGVVKGPQETPPAKRRDQAVGEYCRVRTWRSAGNTSERRC